MDRDKRFVFEGVDAAGKVKKGKLYAESAEKAHALLRNSGIVVSGMKQVKRRKPSVQSQATATNALAAAASDAPIPVKVVDFDMNISSMMWFMIKWCVASVPVAILLSILAFVLHMIWRFMNYYLGNTSAV